MKASVTPEYRERMLEIFKNRSWLDQNVDSIKSQYKGSWIVITSERVVASGAPTGGDAVAAAGSDFDPETSLVFLVPGDISQPF